MVEYVNIPFGRRIAKKLDGKVVEKYLWQGMTRLLAVTDGWNSLLCRFAYADARTPVAMEWGGRTYYLSYDQVGSLRQVTDSAGRTVKVLEYDSFGNLLRDSAPGFFLPIGFAGGLTDRHTGLVRFGYRDYDPGIGRWTAKDPLGFGGGDVDLFGYVGNDPVNGVDATGLVFGSLFSKCLQALRIGSATAQEAGIAGKVADSIIGGLLGIAGTDVVPETGNTKIDRTIDIGTLGLQGWGSYQAFSIANATRSSAPGLALIMSGAGGVGVGVPVNSLIKQTSGMTLGEAIYDIKPKKNDDRPTNNEIYGKNPPDRVVDKKLLVFSLFIMTLFLGAYAIRELYEKNETVQFFFGGLNILYFWYLVAAIPNEFFNYIDKKENRNSTYIMNNLLLYPIVLILVYVLTIICIRSFWSLLVWLPVTIIITLKAHAGGSNNENDQSK